MIRLGGVEPFLQHLRVIFAEKLLSSFDSLLVLDLIIIIVPTLPPKLLDNTLDIIDDMIPSLSFLNIFPLCLIACSLEDLFDIPNFDGSTTAWISRIIRETFDQKPTQNKNLGRKYQPISPLRTVAQPTTALEYTANNQDTGVEELYPRSDRRSRFALIRDKIGQTRSFGADHGSSATTSHLAKKLLDNIVVIAHVHNGVCCA
ncbi:hypothetical protein HG530_013968 [Fusarium avenaceum]|nr:hypothetical protein HG530_013968 [Fusarium avenaceum]